MKSNKDIVISIRNVSKTFTSQGKVLKVLDDVSLDVYDQEFICIVGYSGCGKSTLLRIIAGMETADQGGVYMDGQLHDSPNENVILLFQDYNQLFPWKTVINNIVHPLVATKHAKNKEEARLKAMELLKRVGLSDYANYYPHQLSGGMRQRAAIARALSLEPKVLLMDEPLSALDDVTRKTLRELIRDVCSQCNVTTICVTHSVEEAIIMGTRIVAMNRHTHTIEKIIDNIAYACQEDANARFAMRTEITDFMNSQ